METDPRIDLATLYGAVLDGASQGLVLYEADGPCVWANEAAARLVGGTVEQLCKQDFRTIASWKASGLLGAALEVLETGRPTRRNVEMVTSFGRHVDVGVDLGRVRVGSVAYLLIGYAERAGRRSLSEEEPAGDDDLRRSLLDFQSLVERHPDAILVLDANQQVRFANPQACSMLGTPRDRLLGQPFALPIRGLAGSDLEILRENGSPGRARPRVEGTQWEGRPAWLVTLHDVTEQRGAEAEAMQSGASQAEKRGREALDRLAGSVAHQLNNQLMVLRGHLEMIDDGPRGWTEVARRLPVMFACLEQLEALGRGVMDVGRRQPVGFKPDEPTGGAKRALRRAIPGEPPTILLAEDEDSLRHLVTEALSSSGYRVLGASHGAEAVERARDHAGRLALLLTDVDMPGMDGVELYEALAILRPDLPVLYMSGYAESDHQQLHALAARGRYLQKPFSLHHLLQQVERALAESW